MKKDASLQLDKQVSTLVCQYRFDAILGALQRTLMSRANGPVSPMSHVWQQREAAFADMVRTLANTDSLHNEDSF